MRECVRECVRLCVLVRVHECVCVFIAGCSIAESYDILSRNPPPSPRGGARTDGVDSDGTGGADGMRGDGAGVGDIGEVSGESVGVGHSTCGDDSVGVGYLCEVPDRTWRWWNSSFDGDSMGRGRSGSQRRR